MITIVCSWCKKKIGEKEGGEGISHSVCPECKLKVEEEIRNWKGEGNGLLDNSNGVTGV